MPLFTIRGVDEIRRAYKLLPKAVANKVIRQGLRKAVRPMKAAAQRNAPQIRKTSGGVGRGAGGRFVSTVRTRNTGLTARSIKVRARKRSRKSAIGIDVRIGEGDFKGETFYAAFPNFGTRFQPAQHYMERAFEATQDECRTIAADEIEKGTIREWKSL